MKSCRRIVYKIPNSWFVVNPPVFTVKRHGVAFPCAFPHFSEQGGARLCHGLLLARFLPPLSTWNSHMRTAIPFLLLLGLATASAGDGTLFGTWTFDPARSSELALWRSRTPVLEISGTTDAILLHTTWMEGKVATIADSVLLHPGGPPSAVPTTSAVWPDNWLMGVLAKIGTPQQFTALWEAPGRELSVISTRTVLVSQGEALITTRRMFRLDESGNVLTVTEQRSSRPTPVTMVFQRATTR
jgi:hypothetical protein